MSLTPMMEQYLRAKQEHKDAILFFHLGDFYEMFFEDAEIASRVLEITLTGRDGGPLGRVPMCGVPCHAANSYIARLIEKGYKVAICEQVEDPKSAKGIVRREVTRVVTPGTVIDGQFLDDKSNNYLCALYREGNTWALAAADISTGELSVTVLSEAQGKGMVQDELFRLTPREILVPESLASELEWQDLLFPTVITRRPDSRFTLDAAREVIERQFGEAGGREPWARHPLAAPAVGGLITYLAETQKRPLTHIRTVRQYVTGQYMVLDAATRRNLELTNSIADGSRKGTLLSVLDHTETAMGGRLLKNWLMQPLLDPCRIAERQGAVAAIADNALLRESLRASLHKIYDLERLAARIAYGSANARDLLALKNSLSATAELKEILQQTDEPFLNRLNQALDPCADVRELIERSINEDAPVTLRDGGLIKAGFDGEVDELRSMARDGKEWLCSFEALERERTGIRSLKVGYNRVFGYYIEVTRANLDLVPESYIRRQTLANAERFITPELKEYEDKILGAQDRLLEREYSLFLDIRERVNNEVGRLQQLAAGIACLDALNALAVAAVRYGFRAPQVDEEDRIEITAGRHPVVEQVLGAGTFVPNDTVLNTEQRLVLITGPNMAGKSTYMRQVALIVLMAQIGSFVPAESARIGVVDRIFTRIGASDDLAGGASTFMVEMRECKTIVENATPRSLIIMDEVGRGTSTFDGMSLARALVEYIVERIGAKTLFSTHYHELTDLESLPGVVNYTTTVAEDGDGIIFLRKVVPGKSNRSYGLHVARLAGLPEEILQKAAAILIELENEKKAVAPVHKPPVQVLQMELFGSPEAQSVLEQVRRANIMGMTPLEAINQIYGWQRMLLSEGDKRHAKRGKR
ncbi:MAG: DNA mismatch repair protein MutS [Bacillota bacterium]